MKKVANNKLAGALVVASIITGMIIGNAAQAAVPHTFSANTPARAAEVNANFSDLDQRIAAVESVRSVSCPNVVAPITYSEKITNAGDQFTYSGVNYIIVAMPVIDVSTDSIYVIKYPVPVTDTGTVSADLYAGSYNPKQCGSVAVGDGSLTSTVSYLSHTTGRTNSEASVRVAYTIQTNIKVGTLNFWHSLASDSAKLTALHDNFEVDFTAKFDLTQLKADKAAAIAKADFLLDYISIARVQ